MGSITNHSRQSAPTAGSVPTALHERLPNDRCVHLTNAAPFISSLYPSTRRVLSKLSARFFLLDASNSAVLSGLPVLTPSSSNGKHSGEMDEWTIGTVEQPVRWANPRLRHSAPRNEHGDEVAGRATATGRASSRFLPKTPEMDRRPQLSKQTRPLPTAWTERARGLMRW